MAAHHQSTENPTPLTPDELRRKRLLALGVDPPPEQRQRQDVVDDETTTTTPTTPTTHTTRPPPPQMEGVEDDGDAELQAALALSLHEPPPHDNDNDNNNKVDIEKEENTIQIEQFHGLMWCKTTTREDQERWMDQEIITTPRLEEKTAVSSSSEEKSAGNIIEASSSSSSSHRKLWGLVQRHGGPCGVLAAVQAEMLRLILFGRRDNDDGRRQRRLLEYPTFVGDENDEKSLDDVMEGVEECMVEESMAMAIGMILARCAVRRRTTTTTTTTNVDKCTVRLVFPPPPPEEEERMKMEVEMKTQGEERGYAGLAWESLEPWSGSSTGVVAMIPNAKLIVYNVSASMEEFSGEDALELRLAREVSSLLLRTERGESKLLHYFYRPGGVMLLALSMVESRGVDRIRNDMDDPHGTHLTSQFGHCSQELINLLLTGSATSNVFDNTVTLHSIPLRGILRQPSIGYLTQLESLRYCTVGGYYKTPEFPIWVIGSTHHFSVMFGVSRDVLRETLSDVVLERCRRAFKSVDCAEENGFINVSSLGSVISALDLNEKVGGDAGVQALAAMLEVSGAGIILWDDFWRTTSRLLTGASLENVLHLQDDVPMTNIGGVGVGVGDDNDGNNNTSIVEMAYQTDHNQTATDYQKSKSDEDIAKELSLQWSTEAQSDEELARKLQAQWDAEDAAGQRQLEGESTTVSSTLAVRGDSVASGGGTAAGDLITIDEDEEGCDDDMVMTEQEMKGDEENAVMISSSSFEDMDRKQRAVVSSSNDDYRFDEDGKVASSPDRKQSHQDVEDKSREKQLQQRRLEFEKMGNSFDLYHYNGLRGGKLTAFRVTRLSAEEAVGASVALSSNHGVSTAGIMAGPTSSAAGGVYGETEGGGSGGGRGEGDLEDVVRTKWPSCVFDWGKAMKNNGPPLID